MKLLCDACSCLLPPASWAVVDGTLQLTCAGCGATSTAVREAAPRRVAIAPAGAADAPVVEARDEPRESVWLEAGWAEVETNWDDPEAHRRLLDRAELMNEVPALGRRYKERLEKSPGDAVALRAREELLKRATVRLMVSRTPKPKGGVTAKNVVAATVLLSGLGLVAILLFKLVFPAGTP